MKFKTTGILVLALAAALGYYFWGSGGAKPPATPPDQSLSVVGEGQVLLPLEAGSVNQVSILDPDGVRTTVRKIGDHWSLTEPVAAAATDEAARGLIDALTSLRSSGRPSSDPGSDSGLDKPQFTVALTTDDGKTSTLFVGQKTGAGDLLYARVDGGDINLIDGQTTAALKDSESGLRDKHLLKFQRDEIQQIRITEGNQHLLLERLGGHWRMLEPVDLPAEITEVSGLLSGLFDVEATEFLKPDSDELAFARFDHPTATVWLTTRAPSTQPATEPIEFPSDLTLTVGAPDSLVKDHYFARTGDGTIAKIAGTDVQHLTEVKAWQLRDHALTSISPGDVTGIHITRDIYVVPPPGSTGPAPTAPISEIVIDLRRLGPAALGPAATRPAAPAAEWQFVNEPKGRVDPAKVQTLLAQFQPLRAEAFFGAPPDVSTAQKCVVVLSTASGQIRLDVRIPPGDDAQAVGTYNGLPFQVSRELQNALTADFHLMDP